MPDFPDRIKREIGDKFGERPSALDFIPGSQHTAIRDGSSSADLTSWIQDGLDSLGTAGGGVLYLPWGTYPVLDLSIPSNVALVGDGGAKTVLKRQGTLPAGRGVLNLSGSKSGFSDLAIDGQVTTPATALYSSLSDPSASTLIANSSVRIHPGATDISLSRFRIFHTGGYAVHIDCRTGNVYRITINEPDLHDNRSFLFGATAGSEIYGSWTGGILAQGDGLTNPYALHGFTVRNGRFRRGTGNQIWSHIYGFSTLHSDFKFQGNSFQDIGRDGILVGAAVGGDVSGNNFRRIGYVCVDDVNPGVPRWLNGQWAVGLDTAGLTRGVNFLGNTFVSCYGAAMDLDGFAEGAVSENTVIVPVSGEPEYSEDSVSSWAGNYCYGAQTSNSNNIAAAAVGVRVTNNRFRNCGLGAVRLYAGRKCVVSGNTIEHLSLTGYAPIILGNIGNGANQRASGNTVTDNDVHYSAGSMEAVVKEDPNGFPFTSADVNRVYGNHLHGVNVFEFKRDANSGSTTGQEFSSSQSALTTASTNTLQREDGYLRWYWTSGTTKKSVLSLLDRAALSGGLFGGSLLNVSTDAVGGVIATGARTSSAFDDAILSSKLYADGFFAIAATTFNAMEANLLADTVGLIRYNATTKIFEQSNSVSAGARVWSALAGSSLSGLTAGRVPFTTGASAIGDSANLAWDNTNRVLTVTGVTATASIVAATSFIQAAEGFYTPSASASAIGAPAGGVTALSLISVRNDGAAGLTLARNSATARQYGLGIDASGNFFVRDQTAAAVRITMTTAGLVTFGSSVSIDQSGNLYAAALQTTGTAGIGTASPATESANARLAVVGALSQSASTLATSNSNAGFTVRANASSGYQLAIGATSVDGSPYLQGVNFNGGASAASLILQGYGGVVLINRTSSDSSGAALQLAGFVSATTGFATVSTAYDSIQTANGFLGKQLTVTSKVNPGTSTAGNSVVYMDSTSNQLMASVNGGAFVNLLAPGVTSIAGTTNQVIASAATGAVTLSLPQNIHTNATPTFTGANLAMATIGDHTSLSGSRQAFTSYSYGGAIIGGAAASTFYSLAIGGGNRNAGQAVGFLSFHGFGPNASLNSSLSARVSAICDTSGSTDYGAHIDLETIKSASVSGAASGVRMRITSYGNILVATTTDDTSGAKLQVAGFVSATGGYYAASSSYEALKALSGGVSVRSLHASAYSQLGSGSATPTATTGAAIGAGAIYWDTGVAGLRVYNGSTWNTLLTAGATPTFAGVVATVFNATATGATIAFQTNNSNFQVNGNGVVSSAGGYNAGGLNVIDASQNIYAATLQTTGAAAIGSTDLTAAQLFVRVASVQGLRVHNSATPSSSGGAGIQAAIESAPASGDRLAFYAFGVRSGGSNYNGANFTAFATQAWTLGTAQGTELRFETTPNGAASRSTRMTIGESGTVTIGSLVSIDQAGNLSASSVVSAAGVNVSGSAYNSLQVASGGVYAGLGATLDQGLYLKTFAGSPNSPGGGYGALSHRSGSTYLYWNGSAWATVDLSASLAGAVLTTTNQEVQGFKYFGGPSDRLVIYRSADNVLGIQTMLDGLTDPTTYSYGGTNNALVLQPRAGVVGIGAINGSYTLNVAGNLGVTGGVAVVASATNVGYSVTDGTITGLLFASGLGGIAVGSTSNHPLVFITNNAERGRITATGQVAIGTTTPATESANARLAVVGALSQSASDLVTSNSNAGFTVRANASSGYQLAIGATSVDGSPYLQGLVFSGGSSASSLILQGYGGNVGIGTTNPYLGRLQVTNITDATNAFFQIAANSGGSAEGVIINDDRGFAGINSGRSLVVRTRNDGLNDTGAIASFETIGGSTINALWVGISGAVGIGTASPATNARLHVKGAGNALPASSGSTQSAGLIQRFNDSTTAHLDIGGAGGTGMWLQVSDDTNLTVPYQLFLQPTGGAVLINRTSNDSSGAALQIAGFVSATTGFSTVSTAYNSIQTANGFLGKQLMFTSKANPGGSTAGNAVVYMDSTSSQLVASVNGGAYVNLLASGVMSITGTANQVLASGSIGAVTLSLPQNIDNGATPTFAGVVATVFNSTATGATIAFQTNNSNFQVNGNGVVSSAGGYNAGGLNVIDASRNIYAATLQTSGNLLVNLSAVPAATGGNAPRMTVVGSTRTITTHGENKLLVLPAANNGAASGDAGLYTWISEPGMTWTGAGISRNMYNTTSFPRVNSALTGQMIRFDEGTGIIFTSETSAGARYTPLTLTAANATIAGSLTTAAGVVTTVFNSTATGATIAFQTSNSNFSVDGNGNVSGLGSANMTAGFRVGGTTVIDSSRNASGLASATASGVFQSQATSTSIAFQTTNFNFQVNGNGVVSSAGGINVSGVTCINTSRQFVGYGVDVSYFGISAGGYNVYGGYVGQTWNVSGSFTINGAFYSTLVFRGGILVSAW